jgi:hypothetical protein
VRGGGGGGGGGGGQLISGELRRSVRPAGQVQAVALDGRLRAFLGDKKTINPKIAFLGWERFFILSPKNHSNQLILPHHLS